MRRAVIPRCVALVSALVALAAGGRRASAEFGRVEGQLGLGLSVIRGETWHDDDTHTIVAAQLDGLARLEVAEHVDLVAAGTFMLAKPPHCEDEKRGCGRVESLWRAGAGVTVKSGNQAWRVSGTGLVGWPGGRRPR